MKVFYVVATFLLFLFFFLIVFRHLPNEVDLTQKPTSNRSFFQLKRTSKYDDNVEKNDTVKQKLCSFRIRSFCCDYRFSIAKFISNTTKLAITEVGYIRKWKVQSLVGCSKRYEIPLKVN